MRFTPTAIAGVLLVDMEPQRDVRGSFARAYCPTEFARAGVEFTVAQINLSRNSAALTLRGMHYQEAPFAEAKLVRPARGRMFDVAVDLRPHSPSYRRWLGVTLEAARDTALYIPEGCAHGFLTLEDDTDVLYLMGRAYTAGHARGFRYDDPTIGIAWPDRPQVVATADLAWPALS